jgi:thioredoxin-like negative regulator of GroEL
LILCARELAQRGDWRRAASALESARQFGSGDPRLLADMAQTRLALGDPEEALRLGSQAEVLQRSNVATTRVLSQILIAAGSRPQEAKAMLAKAERMRAVPTSGRGRH